MTEIFCPTCETYLPPDLTACPTCGRSRQETPPVQVSWSVTVAGAPVGPACWVEGQVLLATHDSAQGPGQAALHWLRPADGREARSLSVLPQGRLVAGMRLARLLEAGHAELILLATYSADSLADNGALLALAPDGQELWRWQPGVQAVSAPAVVEQCVWVTTNTGRLVSLDLGDGSMQTDIVLEATPSLAAPLVLEDVAYLPTRGPRLLAVDLAGQTRWRFQLDGGWLDRTPMAVGDWLYAVVNLAGAVVALDRTNGRLVWQFEPGPTMGRRLSPPAGDGQRLYAGGGDGLYAFDLESGGQVWRFPTSRRVAAAPVVAGEIVYAAGHDHHLYALEAATGRELWRYEATARLELAPLLLEEPPLIIIADRQGQVTALDRLFSPEQHETAGRWLAAAEGFAGQGKLVRAAELLQSHGESFKAAQVWHAAGELEFAAGQYEAAGRWSQAADLWAALDRPLRQAGALVEAARFLAGQTANEETQAETWNAAALLYEAEGEVEQMLVCRRELAHCRQQPLLLLKVAPEAGLLLAAWSHVRFTVRNDGYGPAYRLIIRASGDQFEGQVAETRQIAALRAGRERSEWLDVRPRHFGPSVSLRVTINYEDESGQSHTYVHTIYLPVARVEAERGPGQVYHINTAGGAVVLGRVETGGDFVGRDQGQHE